MKIRDISISTCLALLLMGCVAKPPIATESEMKEAAAFAFNVDASQVTISDAKQQDVKPILWPPSAKPAIDAM